MQPTPPAPPPPPAAPPAPNVEIDALKAEVATQQLQAERAALQAQVDAGRASGAAGTRSVPRTAQELAGLRKQRTELGNQLESAQRRRRDVARALERADDPANRAGLEGRLRVLDQRITQLETDMAETGRLITTAPSALFATSHVPPPLRDFDRGPPGTLVAIVAILFGVFPLMLALSRRVWRRGSVPRPDPFQRESAERLARLEQAVEAIAIEVERVSEGQRFVTRLLAESRGTPAVAAAQHGDDTHDALPRYAANR